MTNQDEHAGREQCPDDIVLQEYLDESLAPSVAHRIDAHLEVCRECSHVLDRLTSLADLGTPPHASWHAGTHEPLPEALEVIAQLPLHVHLPADYAAIREDLAREGFTNIELVGGGAAGIVFKAKDAQYRVLAVKVTTGRPLNEVMASDIGHENLVPYLWNGVLSQTNTPFVVMRFVKGVHFPIAGEVDPRKIARWIRQASSGVHALHKRGMAHRDLKPSNILIDSLTEDAIIIDLGLVRHIREKDGTLTREVAGTLPYMAPEQANRDPAMKENDVYSLGVLMYEGLTGQSPFEVTAVRQADDKVLSPRKIQPGIDKDLATICLKCLEYQPEDRYRSAGELADDLERYLADQPVEARPIGLAARAVRRARRHPMEAAYALSAILALVMVAVVSLVGFMMERRQREMADHRLRVAMQSIEDSLVTISGDRLLTSAGFERLRKQLLEAAIARYDQLIQQAGDRPDFKSDRARALALLGRITSEIDSYEKALEYYHEAAALYRELQSEGRQYTRLLAEVLRGIADVHADLDQVEAAEEKYLESISIYKQLIQQERRFSDRKLLARAQSNLANLFSDTGRLAQAETLYVKARSIFAEAHRQDASPEKMADLAKAESLLASFYTAVEQFKKAKPLHLASFQARQKLAQDAEDDDSAHRLAVSNGNLGVFFQTIGRLREANKYFGSAIAIYGRLADVHPAYLEYQEDLARARRQSGVVQQQMGQLRDAESDVRTSMAGWRALIQRRPTVDRYRRELSTTQNFLGAILIATGKLDAAKKLFAERIATAERLAKKHPRVTSYQDQRADAYFSMGVFQQNQKLTREAKTSFDQARKVFLTLMSDRPNDSGLKESYSMCLVALANIYSGTDEFQLAVCTYREVIALRKKLLAGSMPTPSLRNDLAGTHLNLGLAFYQARKLTDAWREYDAALSINEELTIKYPETGEYLSDYAMAMDKIGSIHARLGDFDVAEKWYQRGLEQRRKLVKLFPELAQYRGELVKSLNNVAAARGNAGKPQEAIGFLEEAQHIRDELTKRYPELIEYAADRSMGLSVLGQLYFNLGRVNDAQKATEKAVNLLKPLLQKRPGTPGFLGQLGTAERMMGVIHAHHGNTQKSVAAYERALKALGRLPRQPEYQFKLAETHLNLGMLLENDHSKKAKSHLDKALAIQKPVAEQHPTLLPHQRQLAKILGRLGHLHLGANELRQALEMFQRKLIVCRRLVEEDSALLSRLALATTNNELGNVFQLLKKRRQAREHFEASIELLEKLPDSNLDVIEGLGFGYNNLAAMCENGESLKALALISRSQEQREALLRAKPGNREYQKSLADNFYNKAILLRRQKRHAEAAEAAARAVALHRELARQSDKSESWKSFGKALIVTGDSLARNNQNEKALVTLRECADVRQMIVKRVPDDRTAIQDLVVTRLRIAELLSQAPSAREEYKKVLSTLAPHVSDVGLMQFRRETLLRYAGYLVLVRDFVEASDIWIRVAKLTPTKEKWHPQLQATAALARTASYADATREAGVILKRNESTTGAWYEAACVMAWAAHSAGDDRKLKAEERRRLADSYVAKCLGYLNQAHALGGFVKVSEIRKVSLEPAFVSLSETEAFQQFLKRLYR